MPRMQTFLGPLNAAFSAENIAQLDASLFDPTSDFVSTMADVVRLDAETAEHLRSWPTGLLASVQGLIFHNLQRESPLPITFAWAPNYFYEVRIWDVADTTQTRGGITVLFSGRFPDDTPVSGV